MATKTANEMYRDPKADANLSRLMREKRVRMSPRQADRMIRDARQAAAERSGVSSWGYIIG